MTVDTEGLINIRNTLIQIGEALDFHSKDEDTQLAAKSVALNVRSLAADIREVHHKVDDIIKVAS